MYTFCLRLEIHFMGKYGPKSQNFLFKVKFGININSNMRISTVMSIFSVADVDEKYPF